MSHASQARCKGRFVRKKELQRREKIRKVISARWKDARQNVVAEKRSNNKAPEGCRIIDIDTLSNNMKCSSCKHDLILKDIKNEVTKGLHSTFFVECQQCKNLTTVDTGLYHQVNSFAADHVTDKKHNNITTNAVLGAVYAGIGCTQLNKILACLDIPTISDKLFKAYEREVGPAIEEAARRSCRKAAIEEKMLVLQRLNQLHSQLPEEIQEEFFREMSDAIQANVYNNVQLFDSKLGNIVNIIVSYDMGWSKRGNG